MHSPGAQIAQGSSRRVQEGAANPDSEARRFIEFAENESLRSPHHLQTGLPGHHMGGGSYGGGPDDGMAKLKEAFRTLDTDNSGSLGFEEVRGLLTSTMMNPDPMAKPGWAPQGYGTAGGIGSDGMWAPRADMATGRESPTRGGGFGGFSPSGRGGQNMTTLSASPYVDPTSAGGDDPWAAILAAGSEEFCVVPAVTLERLRAVGEAQLAEIEALRAEIAKSPEVKEETLRLESQLEELEVGRVCAENELELRKLEAGKLAQEASTLRQQRDAMVGQVREAKARVEQLERWLEPSRQGPPQSRADEMGASPGGRADEGGMKSGIQEGFYK